MSAGGGYDPSKGRLRRCAAYAEMPMHFGILLLSRFTGSVLLHVFVAPCYSDENGSNARLTRWTRRSELMGLAIPARRVAARLNV